MTVKRPRSTDWLDHSAYWVILLLAAALPIVSGLRKLLFVSPMITNMPELDTGFRQDLFNEAKFSFLLAVSALLILLLIYRSTRRQFDFEPSPYHVPLLLFALLAVLSLLLSDFPAIALLGFPKHTRMGTATYLAGLAALFAALHTTELRRRPALLLYALVPFLLINVVTTTLYFHGYPLIESGLVKTIFAAPKGEKLVLAGNISTTLDNPNYSSGFGGGATAIFLTAALLLREPLHQAAAILLSAAGFAIVVGSLSSSGFLAVSVLAPLLILFASLCGERRQVLRNGLVCLLAFTALWFAYYVYRPAEVVKETFGFFSQVYREVVQPALSDPAPAPNPAPPPETRSPEEFRLPEPPRHEQTIGTNRGRIWRETLKLIWRRPLTGYGFDTIPYTFPHEDPSIGIEFITVKPHNMLLDIAYGAGIPALLAFLALPMILLWQFLRSLRARAKPDPYLVCLLAGVAAYLIQGLGNDNVIGTWAVFCVWLGASAGRLKAEPAATAVDGAAEHPVPARSAQTRPAREQSRAR